HIGSSTSAYEQGMQARWWPNLRDRAPLISEATSERLRRSPEFLNAVFWDEVAGWAEELWHPGDKDADHALAVLILMEKPRGYLSSSPNRGCGLLDRVCGSPRCRIVWVISTSKSPKV